MSRTCFHLTGMFRDRYTILPPVHSLPDIPCMFLCCIRRSFYRKGCTVICTWTGQGGRRMFSNLYQTDFHQGTCRKCYHLCMLGNSRDNGCSRDRGWKFPRSRMEYRFVSLYQRQFRRCTFRRKCHPCMTGNSVDTFHTGFLGWRCLQSTLGDRCLS